MLSSENTLQYNAPILEHSVSYSLCQSQVHLELKERKVSLDSQDWICLAPKEIKALKDFLASRDSQASLAFLDSKGLLEFQGSQASDTQRLPRSLKRKLGLIPSFLTPGHLPLDVHVGMCS